MDDPHVPGSARGEDGDRAVQVVLDDLLAQHLPARLGARHVGERTDRGDLVGDLGVGGRHDLGAPAQVDLVAVVAGRVVARGDGDARDGAQPADGEGQHRGGQGPGQQGRPEPGADHHGGGVAREVGALVAGVVPDDDQTVAVPVLAEVGREPGGGPDDHHAVHPHRSRAQLPAQPGGAELEGAGETGGQFVEVAGLHEPGQFLAGLRVGVLGQPGPRPRGQFLVHGCHGSLRSYVSPHGPRRTPARASLPLPAPGGRGVRSPTSTRGRSRMPPGDPPSVRRRGAGARRVRCARGPWPEARPSGRPSRGPPGAPPRG